ncbi:MAG: hypothetical protein VKJ27_07190 [Synechocystis sp.]|nr:hypothetical protein [Synechocystis sp.]
MSSPDPPVQDRSDYGVSPNGEQPDAQDAPSGQSRFHLGCRRLWQRWADQPKLSVTRLLGVAGLTLVSLVGLDLLCAPLTPLSHPLLLSAFFPPESTDADLSRPLTAEELDALIDPNAPPVGRRVTMKERQKILALLGQPPDFVGGFVPGPENPLIILHDTAAELSRAELENRPKYTETPLGDGIAAYVPREGPLIFTRTVLFTPYRPTAAAYEKALDFATETERDQRLRQVWQVSHPTYRQQAIQRVVDQLDQPPSDLVNRAALWFKVGSNRAFMREYARNPRGLDGGRTTAIWAIAALCQQVLTDSSQLAQAAASPTSQPQLKQACDQVNPQLQASQNRLASSMNIELVQKEGSDCFISDADVQAYNRIADPAHKIAKGRAVPLETYSRPAYTDSQYDALVQLYLWGAIYAGRFPELVTHFWLDQGNGKVIGTHCDPRGLNLNRLYREIAIVLGHPTETQYGATPQYGRNPAQGDNVWWSNTIMGGEAPTADTGQFNAF